MKESDTQIIEQLFHQYFDRLYSLIYYKVGGKQDIAEDIVQETFLAATKSIGSFKHRSSLYTWLVSIAYHKITDYYRRSYTSKKHYGTIASLDTIDENKMSLTISQNMNMMKTGESSALIREILYQLPEDYRVVLLLKYIEGMSVSKIASILGRSEKSCEGLLFRARNAFRKKCMVSSENM